MEASRRTVLAGGAALTVTALSPAAHALPARPEHVRRVQDLLAQMTLEEKFGQLNQPAGGRQKALNSRIDAAALDLVRRGGVGSYLHVMGAQFLRDLQRVAVEESRLKIPLLFAMDVIHGFRTIYPVPLGIAASFEPEVARKVARMAAVEASVAGLHWTFSPMVDIARDPRWGRIVEGAGEDPFLGSAIAVAHVQGYQGDDLRGKDVVLSCAKHFVAYGAAEGGRDYDRAELSDRTLQEVYLPPFYASAKAGAATFMTAFNEVSGTPMHANAPLNEGLLRDGWKWDGLIVSDWGAIAELIPHGVAGTPAEAAALALKAGVDMDMAGGIYVGALREAIAADPSLMPYLDRSVGRVLMTKARLGLFEDPYRFGDPAREKTVMLSPAHRAIAREAAHKSMVLLKNEGGLLPIAPSVRRIAVVGALADDASSALGSWRARGQAEEAKTLLTALRESAGSRVQITYEPGAGTRDANLAGVPAAVAVAQAADLTLLVIGEDYDHSGEARSRADINLPAPQAALAKAVLDTGKPVVVVLMNGRPLALADVLTRAPAALETWFLGVESGPAIVDVLFGKVAPGGKLPVGMPRASGGAPAYYAHPPTGRPADPDLAKDTARYMDVDVGPLFPFGHGLSYADFRYSEVTLDRREVGPDGSVAITVAITNTGKVTADEVVQLYMRDPVAATARPVKELRGFKRLTLRPGETRRVSFRLAAAQTAFWEAGRWRIQKGLIEVMVGASSEDIRSRSSFTITADGWGAEPAAAIVTPTTVA
ncbi:glycoside hydrolase family 3 N-terminal domain-containing protein [Phenylobacterium deserti]|uniref:Beta-D-glucoside glucohydrolase n=1 Tax=Phenylobacterium deserti TaxID=1914756 RepID=A0A328ATX0_9CAUL|nr:glycoside hydrolase family 3 N-terminal domain-containing protein [Phenylobacterium deserti]RAK57671.1 beta-glucosidase [Phenylobacterium deserti]